MSTATKLAIPTGSWECQTTMMQTSTAKPASWSNTGRGLHRDHTFVGRPNAIIARDPTFVGVVYLVVVATGSVQSSQDSTAWSVQALDCGLVLPAVSWWEYCTLVPEKLCLLLLCCVCVLWLCLLLLCLLLLCLCFVFVVVVFVVVVIVFFSHFQATTYSRTSLDSAKSCSTTKRRSRIVSKPQESRVVCIPALHPPISFFYPIHSHRMRSCLVNLLVWSRWQGTEAGVSLERLTGHLAAAAPAQQQDLVRENYREYIQ